LQRLNDQAVSNFTGQRPSVLLMMRSANKIAFTTADSDADDGTDQ